MPDIADIKVAKNGEFISLLGQSIAIGGQFVQVRGGFHIRKDGQWHRYREAVPFDVKVYAEGPQIRVMLTSLGRGRVIPAEQILTADAQYRTASGRDYWYNYEYLKATAHLSLTVTKHTGSTQDIEITTSPLECTGASSPYVHTLPEGTICTDVAIKSCEVTLNGEEAYTTGPVTATSYPWTLHGVVSVTPEGTGEASVTPRTATYGQQVTFRALNTDPEYWRFVRWQSGEISPTYTVTVYADYSDTAIFADATKIIDFYIAASIDPDTQDIIFFIKTEYDRTDNPATVRFNLRYFYQDQTNILPVEQVVPCNGTEVRFSPGDKATSLDAITDIDITVPAGFTKGDVTADII